MDGCFYNHDLLKRKAAELNPNVSQLCRELGISRTHYYDILSGAGVSPKTLARLCPKLGLTYSEVIHLEPIGVG